MVYQPNEEVAGPAPGPVTLADRLPALDVLRGFALLGILLSNITVFAAPLFIHDIPLDVLQTASPHHRGTMIAVTLQWLFVEGRMRALFAALFGAGTVLLLERIERRRGGVVAADIFHRRNMWLLAFGLLHGMLIWFGDILFEYSVAALIALYPFRRVAGRTLIVAGVIVAAGGLTVSRSIGVTEFVPTARAQADARAAIDEGRQPTRAEMAAIATARRDERKTMDFYSTMIGENRTSLFGQLPLNFSYWVYNVSGLLKSTKLFEVIGLMMMGMGLYKTGFITGRLSSRVYAAVAVVGYAISGTVTLVGLHQAELFDFSPTVVKTWLLLPFALEEIPGMLANASVVLLIIRAGALMPAQRGLAAVGRTAFSNYILTSLLCQFLFRWGPLHLYATLAYEQQLLVVVAVWVVNIAFSLLWLRAFAYGPLEWLWRSLTYWQRQPMRQRSVAATRSAPALGSIRAAGRA